MLILKAILAVVLFYAGVIVSFGLSFDAGGSVTARVIGAVLMLAGVGMAVLAYRDRRKA